MTNLLLFLGLVLPLRPLLVPWLTSHVLLCFALAAFSCYYLILYVQTDCNSMQHPCTAAGLADDQSTFNPRPYLISDARTGYSLTSSVGIHNRAYDHENVVEDGGGSECVDGNHVACTVLLGYSSSIVAAIILLTYLIYLVQVRKIGTIPWFFRWAIKHPSSFLLNKVAGIVLFLMLVLGQVRLSYG